MSTILPIFNNEDEVKHWYTNKLERLGFKFKSILNTDGIYEKGEVKILSEYKKRGDLRDNKFLIKCLCQVIAYIKKMENNGEKLPNIILIGTENRFYIFESIILEEYLYFHWDSKAPRYWFDHPPEEIINKMNKINIKSFSIDNIIILKETIDNYKSKDEELKLNINNINTTQLLFEEFMNSNIISSTFSVHKQIHFFKSMIFDELSYLTNDESKIIILIPDSDGNEKAISFKINRSNFEAFKKILNTVKTLKIKDDILEQLDKLIDVVTKKSHGEFYTPIFVALEAYNLIDKTIGIDWKEKYRVWDPACGLANLTRFKVFKKLSLSTLFQEDIDIINQRNYNHGSSKFQYNFLEDDINIGNLLSINDSKLSIKDPNLDKDIKDKNPIIFFQNLPFKNAGDIQLNKKYKIIKFSNGKSAQTIKNKKIDQNSAGNLTRELACIFLFQNCEKIINNKLDGSYICTFLKTSILIKPGFYNLREYFYKSGFDYLDGFEVSASVFGLSNNWGISFVIFKYNKINENRSIDNFKDEYLIKRYNNLNKTLIKFKGCKNSIIVEYAKSYTKKLQDIKVPSLSSAINPTKMLSNNKIGALGYLAKGTYTCLVSSIWIISGTPVIKENFKECIAIYTAYKLIPNNWLYSAIELHSPNINHSEYQQWNNDCIIYSLFNSELSSLRNIECKGFWGDVKKENYNHTLENIENEWFWMSNKEMYNLAIQYNYEDLEQDCELFNQDRYIYKELQNTILSEDAQEILNMAKDLVIKSFKYREKFNKQLYQLKKIGQEIVFLKQHLQAWDAGWYQIKLILNEYMKEELEIFNNLFEKFENRLRENLFKFNYFNF